MKRTAVLAVILPVLLLLIPLPSLNTASKSAPAFDIQSYETKDASQTGADTFRVLMTESGEIKELTAEEYIFGVLSAEMPALYHEEALKAQSVAAYTFACRRREANKANSYDISDDHTVDQAYISEEEAREKWGKDADTYITKLRNIVNETAGLTVTYEGSAALTVYHSLSSGRTESAEDIWGSAVPYLIAVDSSADRLAKNYLRTFEFTDSELKSALSELCKLEGTPADWIGESRSTDSGTVTSIQLCGTAVTGAEIRKALELPSSNFDIVYKNEVFTVTCKGSGHGVGMSQNGANAMAKQGSSFTEILEHYYPECKIEKI